MARKRMLSPLYLMEPGIHWMTLREARTYQPLYRHALYRLYDADGLLLYVGITSWRIADRFNGHTRSKCWWPTVAWVGLEMLPGHRYEVERVERAVIRREKPLYNKRSAVFA